MPLSFSFGRPPENPLLSSDAGWSRVPGYDDAMPATLRAIAVGLTLAALLAIAWRSLVPDGLPFVAKPELTSVFLVFFIGTILHELCHLIVFPSFGLRHSVVGVWPQMGAMYAQYLLPVKRGRFIVATLSPAAIICGLPLILGISGFPVPAFLQWASVVNGVAVGADLLAVAMLLRHGAAKDLILDSGHALYRREA
jgi:Putative zincin peptidase